MHGHVFVMSANLSNTGAYSLNEIYTNPVLGIFINHINFYSASIQLSQSMENKVFMYMIIKTFICMADLE